MHVVNGINIYEPGEAIKLPDDYPPIPTDDDQAHFGFRLVDDGVKKWIHASEDNFRALEVRMGTTSEDIDKEIKKRLSEPKYGCRFTSPNVCVGTCGDLSHFVCAGRYSNGPGSPQVDCQCRG